MIETEIIKMFFRVKDPMMGIPVMSIFSPTHNVRPIFVVNPEIGLVWIKSDFGLVHWIRFGLRRNYF